MITFNLDELKKESLIIMEKKAPLLAMEYILKDIEEVDQIIKELMAELDQPPWEKRK